jgi:hypothetical protein
MVLLWALRAYRRMEPLPLWLLRRPGAGMHVQQRYGHAVPGGYKTSGGFLRLRSGQALGPCWTAPVQSTSRHPHRGAAGGGGARPPGSTGAAGGTVRGDAHAGQLHALGPCRARPAALGGHRRAKVRARIQHLSLAGMPGQSGSSALCARHGAVRAPEALALILLLRVMQ